MFLLLFSYSFIFFYVCYLSVPIYLYVFLVLFFLLLSSSMMHAVLKNLIPKFVVGLYMYVIYLNNLKCQIERKKFIFLLLLFLIRRMYTWTIRMYVKCNNTKKGENRKKTHQETLVTFSGRLSIIHLFSSKDNGRVRKVDRWKW